MRCRFYPCKAQCCDLVLFSIYSAELAGTECAAGPPCNYGEAMTNSVVSLYHTIPYPFSLYLGKAVGCSRPLMHIHVHVRNYRFLFFLPELVKLWGSHLAPQVYIEGAVFITVPSLVTFILHLHSRDLVSELAAFPSDSHNEVLFLLCCV